MGIKVMAFDADDTLWVNELYFQSAKKQFFDHISYLVTCGLEHWEDAVAHESMKTFSKLSYVLDDLLAAVS
jgi:hypothetical protein